MIEKFESCPDCNKGLDQAEYDGQYCRACGTEPFGFQSPKHLAGMIEFVGKQYLAINQAAGEHGQSFEDHKAWRERHHQAVEDARRILEARGAKTKVEWNGSAIKLMGIRSTSTSGFQSAMSNWLRAARTKLDKEVA